MNKVITNKNVQTWSRKIHIYSSIALLVSMFFFAVTGLTLNRPELYVAEPNIKEWVAELPTDFTHTLSEDQQQFESSIVEWSKQQGKLKGIVSPVRTYTRFNGEELVEGEVEFDFKGPGYDASVFIDLAENEVEFRVADYGTVAWLNDLHKGRNTGAAWHLFIDIASVVMLLFIVTGFILLFPKKKTLNVASKWLFFGTLATVFSYYLSY
ncbi:PepSY-associated TM helix domain-containing protein [Vibrio sp. WXL103]|uniref:PepSY-associated TM helix domain-containing protein n=1 Tax=unclassified Vibrio TaxID=2614977 RepID=UPI003EC5089E